MNTLIFDGRSRAKELEITLQEKAKGLSRRPKLVSILIGENKGSELYLSLKQKAAERLDLLLTIKKISAEESVEQLVERIRTLNEDDTVTGIMIQLPFPARFSEKEKQEIISSIKDEKDVDGMKETSMYITPVVLSVLNALGASGNQGRNIAVVGAKGFVGQKLSECLKGYNLIEIDTDSDFKKLQDADVIISASGKIGIIKKEQVKEGVICIDVGAPDAEFDKGVKEKARFFTPVPGGIGPLTISYLMYNLIEAGVANNS